MSTAVNQTKIQEQATIRDFGDQWTRFQGNAGYYGSLELFQDIMGPLVQPEELQGKKVAEIGSGTGRIVNMLLDAGVGSVIALEPSDAFEVLKKNTADRQDKIGYIRDTGDHLPGAANLDFVFSIGVIHHIPDPKPTLRAMYNGLKPGGSCVIWLYGHEGNELYLALARVMRGITTILPDFMLSGLATVLSYLLEPYVALARLIPVPMRSYFLNHYSKLPRESKKITLFDQLNPCYAKYYREQEAKALMEEMGFSGVKLYRRHGYSWTVRGEKV